MADTPDNEFAMQAALAADKVDLAGGQQEDDSSQGPTTPKRRRCKRCARAKKGCDGSNPCGRCVTAGLGPEECVPDDSYGASNRRRSSAASTTISKTSSAKKVKSFNSSRGVGALSTNAAGGALAEGATSNRQSEPNARLADASQSAAYSVRYPNNLWRYEEPWANSVFGIQSDTSSSSRRVSTGGQKYGSSHDRYDSSEVDEAYDFPAHHSSASTSLLDRQREWMSSIHQEPISSFETEFAAVTGQPSEEAMVWLNNWEIQQARAANQGNQSAGKEKEDGRAD